MKLLSLFFMQALLLAACTSTSENPSVTVVKQEVSGQIPAKSKGELSDSLAAFLHEFAAPPQVFRFRKSNVLLVRGKQGTVVKMKVADLETIDHQPVRGEVVVELRELFDKRQLVAEDAQTVSNGSLLVSGGALCLNVSSGGQTLYLKEGRTATLELPQFSSEKMSLFYGERDSSNSMNWISGKADFTTGEMDVAPFESEAMIISGGGKIRDTSYIPLQEITAEQQQQLRETEAQQRLVREIYAPVALDRFGWINCDRFYDSDSPLTAVVLEMAELADFPRVVKVFMIFEEIQSVMSAQVEEASGDSPGRARFEKIPTRLPVRFLAVGYENSRIYAHLTPVTRLRANHHDTITLQTHTPAELEALMSSLH